MLEPAGSTESSKKNVKVSPMGHKDLQSTSPCAQIWSILNTCCAFGGRHFVKSEGELQWNGPGKVSFVLLA